MLINLSNHPSPKWDKKQTEEALKLFGSITDLSFPAIGPNWDIEEVKKLAEDYFGRITTVFGKCKNEPFRNAVHLQGEFTFVFNLVKLLEKAGIRVLASTTNRNVIEDENGLKTVKFDFAGFRGYF